MQQPLVSLSHHTSRFDWHSRLKAAAIHLGLSALVAATAGLLVFALWYPWPYREISGGRELFQLVVAVDVALGPLITFAIFNRAKPRTELRRDLAIVALLQLGGLAYGLWTVHLARPVHLVYEVDRFRVVHQVDIPEELVQLALSGIPVAPPGGPTLIALRPFRNQQESLDYTMQALQGVQLAAQPALWQPYGEARQRVIAAARPVAQLERRFPQQATAIEEALRKAGRDADHAAYLPMVARKALAWTVLLDAGTAEVIGFLPLDSF
ncbi:MAG TPA: TfpX/TfpZ family type IV pilin accessory protein [Ramlibacter sp.]|uniref:TfpX/TfpZ family type IV pilin accessory protein n=1 Tax=Ramlibacter sp. TaxID=1917967 RepID=UPI002D8047DF|nr:TfpX/TfpZ family type IV pilin accessory protein [Ramlibacter sp.]HET8747990.1 TfpX/TfpZ family type IV pilin accessory protein [Ramlibacter sp.]